MCGPGAPWTPPPRGLSHATPLVGCCVTVHDPSPAHAGGSRHPCQGVSPTINCGVGAYVRGFRHPDNRAIARIACCTHLAAENRPSHEKGVLQSSNVSHRTLPRCWRRLRSIQSVRDTMRCRGKPVSRTARSAYNRFPVATIRNGGRRLPMRQASAGPEGRLVQISIGPASVVRRRKRCAVPRPVSRSVC